MGDSFNIFLHYIDRNVYSPWDPVKGLGLQCNLNVMKPVKSSTLTINISLRGAKRRFFLPDSFVLCKNASNKPNFIDICAEVAKLNNYRPGKFRFPFRKKAAMGIRGTKERNGISLIRNSLIWIIKYKCNQIIIFLCWTTIKIIFRPIINRV